MNSSICMDRKEVKFFIVQRPPHSLAEISSYVMYWIFFLLLWIGGRKESIVKQNCEYPEQALSTLDIRFLWAAVLPGPFPSSEKKSNTYGSRISLSEWHPAFWKNIKNLIWQIGCFYCIFTNLKRICQVSVMIDQPFKLWYKLRINTPSP